MRRLFMALGIAALLTGQSLAATPETDYSANAATIPLPGFVLLQTIPVTPARSNVEIQNQSAASIQVVRDDGSGGNQTSFMLSSGGAAGVQGGDWSSTTFKGRIRIYGTAGSQIAAGQE